MDRPLAAIFYYADGCSRWIPNCLPDPPPEGIDLRTDQEFTEGHHRFRLQAVHKDFCEAWYAEVAAVASGWSHAA
jgi:hypothetical protein